MGKIVKRGQFFSSSFSSSLLKAVFVFSFLFPTLLNLARLLWQCSGFTDLA